MAKVSHPAPELDPVRSEDPAPGGYIPWPATSSSACSPRSSTRPGTPTRCTGPPGVAATSTADY